MMWLCVPNEDACGKLSDLLANHAPEYEFEIEYGTIGAYSIPEFDVMP